MNDNAASASALVALVIMLGLLSIAWMYSREAFPGVAGAIERVVRRIVGTIASPRGGIVGRAQIAWTVVTVFVVIASLGLLAGVGGSALIEALAGLICFASMWLVVIAGWYVIRWAAREQHKPRPLPRRFRRR